MWYVCVCGMCDMWCVKEGQELAKSTEPFVMRVLVSRLGFREAVEDS